VAVELVRDRRACEAGRSKRGHLSRDRRTVPGTRPEALRIGLRAGWEEHDVDLAGPVHADSELLLDVGAPARPGHDRERAW
jgi:hypothetical protein